MAAAYAALVSVSNLMDQIQPFHVGEPTYHDEQRRLIESLQEKVRFLITFYERYPYGDDEEAEDLGRQIADLAYIAEDIIESHVLDDITACKRKIIYRTSKGQKSRFRNFSQPLQKVIEEMESIEKNVVKMMEKVKPDNDDQQVRDLVASGTGSFYQDESTTMVGHEDILGQIVAKLTQVRPDHVQQIAITGMGGIGKTTLVRTVYKSPSIVEHFDVRCWAVISQEYEVKEILIRLLGDITGGKDIQSPLGDITGGKDIQTPLGDITGGKDIQTPLDDIDGDGDIQSPLDEITGGDDLQRKPKKGSGYRQVGEKVRKQLWKRRYLLILDDAWSIEAWDKLKLFFPDNRNGSRIVLTTRLLTVANDFGSSFPYKLDLLSENHSWSLLRIKVFGNGCCPPTLENIGKRIAKNCNGLPLSISVVGGLLAKSKMTQEHWKNIALDINAVVNSEEDEVCLKIISLSYRNLPCHLKPCFLYMCVFPEDHDIRVSEIIKLWMAEGFLKPSKTKRIEELAEDYLKELIDRNLLSSSQSKWWGAYDICNIHDLLRDFCLREAVKERFCYVTNLLKPRVSNGMTSPHRAVIHCSAQNENYSFRDSPLRPARSIRSLTCGGKWFELQLPKHRLLRMFSALGGYLPDDVFKHLNLRYIRVSTECPYEFPSKITMLWNLQTLIVHGKEGVILPSEIWEMRRLRHIFIKPRVVLPDPQGTDGGKAEIVLQNLQTLKYVKNFRCTEEIVRKIPSIRKLRLYYYEVLHTGSYYCLNNLVRLHTLQSLQINFLYKDQPNRQVILNLEFPMSLRKLRLYSCDIDWEYVARKIGPLPYLEELYLSCSTIGEEWHPADGQFLHLTSLSLDECDLVYWGVDSTHFPQLENLGIYDMKYLEIPSEIGDIQTLKQIVVYKSSNVVVRSAKMIIHEQRGFGNEEIVLIVDKEDYNVKAGIMEEEDEERNNEDNDEDNNFDNEVKEDDDDSVVEVVYEKKTYNDEDVVYGEPKKKKKKKRKKNNKPDIKVRLSGSPLEGTGVGEILELYGFEPVNQTKTYDMETGAAQQDSDSND